ncbi:metal-dependent transcriptional regulator [Defluviitalea phaphyphila]|uniref:metal-dependent transcriptional regulator n=1 Tax=Defluviitalea phaphyphila TaxID=1473580 RepID=UPI000730B439|nr:metal-dependent transcriptional regulator [Defluviitalea phaphyphila]
MYESRENYLETILILKQKKGSVRSIDVARELGFSKPSVSRAMGILKESGHIKIDSSGEIILTEKGLNKANDIYERHKLLTKFLVDVIGVKKEIAENDACKMEHIISKEVFEGIKNYMKKIKISRKK